MFTSEVTTFCVGVCSAMKAVFLPTVSDVLHISHNNEICANRDLATKEDSK